MSEQEHLSSLDSTSNIILFVLAMAEEKESHMKSETMLLSLEWRFSRDGLALLLSRGMIGQRCRTVTEAIRRSAPGSQIRNVQ